jgi:heme exporter protein A
MRPGRTQDMTLQAKGLAFERGQRRLFSDIAFEVGAGEALLVKGRNGSGKTSLLRVLCGLAQPLEGEVFWRGRPVIQQRETFHQDLLYIGHGQGLKDDLSAWENVHFNAVLADQLCTPAQALAALEEVGLSAKADLPARVLSQGQRRRVLLARLALTPADKVASRLLVLDEPFVALDGESVQALRGLLERQLAGGATLVYTTHQDQLIEARRVHEIEMGSDARIEAV